MKKDVYWEEVVPPELPHTLASRKCNNDPPETSTAQVVVSHKEGEIVSPALLSIETIVNMNVKFRKRASIAAKKEIQKNSQQGLLEEQQQEETIINKDNAKHLKTSESGNTRSYSNGSILGSKEELKEITVMTNDGQT
jgi:hypothetical protein